MDKCFVMPMFYGGYKLKENMFVVEDRVLLFLLEGFKSELVMIKEK